MVLWEGRKLGFLLLTFLEWCTTYYWNAFFSLHRRFSKVVVYATGKKCYGPVNSVMVRNFLFKADDS